MAVLGIYFGEENITAAIYTENGIKKVKFDNEENLLPCIYFNDNRIIVGRDAYKAWKLGKGNTIIYPLKLLGKTYKEVINIQSPIGNINFEKDKDSYPFYCVERNDEETPVYPEEICAILLENIKLQAEQIEEVNEVEDVVITVPIHFTHRERIALLESAKLLDLNVLCLINESTALALGLTYDALSLSKQEKKYLVCNFGTTSFDLSLINLSESGLKVEKILICHEINKNLIEKIILNWVESKLNKKIKDFQVNIQNVLLSAIKDCIHKLAIEDISKYDFNDYITLNTIDFTSLMQNMIQNVLEKMHKFLEKENNASNVEIILCGKIINSPFFKIILKENFNRIHSVEEHENYKTKGACLAGNKNNKIIIEDLLSSDIILEDSKGSLTIFSSGTILPNSFKTFITSPLFIKINNYMIIYEENIENIVLINADKNGVINVSKVSEVDIKENYQIVRNKNFGKLQKNLNIYKGTLLNEESLKSLCKKLESMIEELTKKVQDLNVPIKYKVMFNNLCEDVRTESKFCKNLNILSMKINTIKMFNNYIVSL